MTIHVVTLSEIGIAAPVQTQLARNGVLEVAGRQRVYDMMFGKTLLVED